MARTERAAFTLRLGPREAESLHVRSFSGSEGLNRPFEFQVDFFAWDDIPLPLEELLGQETLLTLQVREGTPRYVHGVVRAVEMVGRRDRRWNYQAWVVPRLWLLTRVARSRFFQAQSAPQIVQAVLKEGGVKHRVELQGSYTPREYCTQYRETDFAFISRLLEWEGISYHFEHNEQGHTLVLGDSPGAFQELPGGASLPIRQMDGRVHGEEYVFDLERVHRQRPGAVHLKDYDFEKPGLDVSAQRKSAKGVGSLEVYDYPGEYVEPAAGKATSRVRLEEAVQAAETLEGQSICPRLTPGYRVEVESPGDGTWEGQFVMVEVQHFGQQPETPGGAEVLEQLYRNAFKGMPKAVPFRPRRLTPVPVLAGPQTATVVGPAGEEIYTDKHGRIKVRFHWDREGTQDEKSSCWVRVAQAWGGLAWGALFLPRIGQEVLVRFLEGNPDRPLVCGAVYNGSNPPPYGLPDEKTKSTLRSASSPGSEGYNEVRLEDAAGAEEIFVHAQKDERLITRNDKSQQVRGYEDLLVKKDRTQQIDGYQRLDVRGDDVEWIGENQSLRVAGDRLTTVHGSHDEQVEENQTMMLGSNRTIQVSQAASESVGGAAALNIGAGYLVNVALASNEAVGGLKSEEIAGAYAEHVIGSRQESVSTDSSVKVGGDYQTEVKGQWALSVGKDLTDNVGRKLAMEVEQPAALLAKGLELKADKFLLIVGEKLILSLEKSGELQLFANTLTLDGSQVQFKGSKIKKLGAGSLKRESVGPVEIQPLTEQKDANSLKLSVKDSAGKPLADAEYVLKLPDGSERKGKLDSQGKAQVDDLPLGSCELSFPKLKGHS